MNTMKRLIAVMLILTIALCVVACAQPQDNGSKPTNNSEPTGTSSTTTQPSSTTKPGDPEPTFIVTVVDQDGNPVAGAVVTLCDERMCYDALPTDENGVVNFYNTGLKGAMAKVVGAEGYTYSEDYTMFGDSNSITITVTAIAE